MNPQINNGTIYTALIDAVNDFLDVPVQVGTERIMVWFENPTGLSACVMAAKLRMHAAGPLIDTTIRLTNQAALSTTAADTTFGSAVSYGFEVRCSGAGIVRIVCTGLGGGSVTVAAKAVAGVLG